MIEKEFTITPDDIIKQVKAKAYYTSRSRGETSAMESTISDILDSENSYFITGSLATAIGSVQSAIGVFAPCSVSGNTLTIKVPDHFDDSAIASLAANATQYCEAKVLYDWFAATSPADTSVYAQLMTQALAEIQSNMRRRVHPSLMSDASTSDT